jgi:hypothetical protein
VPSSRQADTLYKGDELLAGHLAGYIHNNKDCGTGQQHLRHGSLVITALQSSSRSQHVHCRAAVLAYLFILQRRQEPGPPVRARVRGNL